MIHFCIGKISCFFFYLLLLRLDQVIYNTKQNDVCLSICLYQRISLTAEPIAFSLTGQLLICLRKVYNYFGGGYHQDPKRNHKKLKKKPRLERNIENNYIFEIKNKHLKCHQRPLGAQPRVYYYINKSIWITDLSIYLFP